MTPRSLTAAKRLELARLGAFLMADSIAAGWRQRRGERFSWRGRRNRKWRTMRHFLPRRGERAIRDYLMGSASDETLRSMARRARQLQRRGR